MIWHVYAKEFIRFLEDDGFRQIGETERHVIYERGADRVQVRKSITLTQSEVDTICDVADIKPPKMDSFFGD